MQNPWLNFGFIITRESPTAAREQIADEIAAEVHQYVQGLVNAAPCSLHGDRTLKMGSTVTCFDVGGRIVPIVYCCDVYSAAMNDHWNQTRILLQSKYSVDLIHPDEL